MMLWYYKRLIDKYDVISFDVFDTLVERKCKEPERVFKHVGKRILGDKNVNEFIKHRISAEQQARKNSIDGEVTIGEIYDCFKFFRDEIEELKACEIDYEINNCVPRKNGKDIFELACSKGKKMVVVSDMYLTSKSISSILSSCGYSGIKYVFVSNECGCNKRSGKLFEYVKHALLIDSNMIIHIGDSFKSDILGGKKSSIKTIWLLKRNLILHYLFRIYIKMVYK